MLALRPAGWGLGRSKRATKLREGANRPPEAEQPKGDPMRHPPARSKTHRPTLP